MDIGIGIKGADKLYGRDKPTTEIEKYLAHVISDAGAGATLGLTNYGMSDEQKAKHAEWQNANKFNKVASFIADAGGSILPFGKAMKLLSMAPKLNAGKLMSKWVKPAIAGGSQSGARHINDALSRNEKLRLQNVLLHTGLGGMMSAGIGNLAEKGISVVSKFGNKAGRFLKKLDEDVVKNAAEKGETIIEQGSPKVQRQAAKLGRNNDIADEAGKILMQEQGRMQPAYMEMLERNIPTREGSVIKEEALQKAKALYDIANKQKFDFEGRGPNELTNKEWAKSNQRLNDNPIIAELEPDGTPSRGYSVVQDLQTQAAKEGLHPTEKAFYNDAGKALKQMLYDESPEFAEAQAHKMTAHQIDQILKGKITSSNAAEIPDALAEMGKFNKYVNNDAARLDAQKFAIRKMAEKNVNSKLAPSVEELAAEEAATGVSTQPKSGRNAQYYQFNTSPGIDTVMPNALKNALNAVDQNAYSNLARDLSKYNAKMLNYKALATGGEGGEGTTRLLKKLPTQKGITRMLWGKGMDAINKLTQLKDAEKFKYLVEKGGADRLLKAATKNLPLTQKVQDVARKVITGSERFGSPGPDEVLPFLSSLFAGKPKEEDIYENFVV